MKKIITICAAIFMTASVFAQSPNKMSYQAVIRNSSNALVTSSAVGMRISILQTSPSGTAVYVETQTPTTNANGLVSIEIGGGTVVAGNFANINWANGPYFVKTETDPAGGTSYSITGTSQLLSVPYALHAKTVEIDNVQDGDTTYWKVNGNNLYYNQGFIGIGSSSPQSQLQIVGSGSNPAELTLNSPGSTDFHHGAIVMKASGLTNKRALGLFMVDTLGVNEWFIGRPYGSGLGGNSDRFVIQRLATSNHNSETSGLANGANTPTGTVRLLTLTNTGNLGLGTTTPARALHVSDVMRLEPRSSAPTSPSKGDIYFDNTLNKLRVYDGTTWQNCW